MMKKYLTFLCGLLIISLVFKVFIEPYNLAATGVGGLAIVLNNFVAIDISIFILVVNLFLIILSYLMLGSIDTRRTIVGSLLYPIILKLFSFINIDLSGVDLLLISIVGGIGMGFGLGLIFKSGFTTGGTDIIEAIVVKYFKISMDYAIILVDGFIVLLCGFVFGLEHMIYAIIILLCIGVFSNKYMLGLGEDRVLFIISSEYKKIKQFLIEKYHYGITIMDAKGGYCKHKEKVLMISIKKDFYIEIMEEIKKIDENVFITVCNSYETYYFNKDERKRLKKV